MLQSRALTGARVSTNSAHRATHRFAASNGTKWTMRRKDSYMVEVQVQEDESEDVAVRRFMKSVVQSGVINQLRARRYKESAIEMYKRKLADRAMARKLKIEQPTWSDAYGHDDEPKPFEEFFRKGAEADDMDIFGDMSPFGGAADTELLLGNLDAGGFYGPLAGGGYVGGGGAAGGGGGYADGGAAAGGVAGGAAEPAGDVFDLAAFEAQQGGAPQAPQQNNGTW